jgi:hypothetical protein
MIHTDEHKRVLALKELKSINENKTHKHKQNVQQSEWNGQQEYCNEEKLLLKEFAS